MQLDQDDLEKIAEAVHKVWIEGRILEGWKLGDKINKEQKIHNCLVPYAQLSEIDKDSDRDIARGIPRILEMAGFKLVKADKYRKIFQKDPSNLHY